MPTSYLLRVSENWNGRVVVVIPPGIANQTFFIPFMVMLLNEGYAVAAMNQPEPGFPGFPYEDFIGPPYSTKDFRNRYLATGHQLKDLITAVFGEPAGTYAFGLSRGTLEGTQILEDESGTPFDGYVLGLGGNGLPNQLMSLAESYQAIPNRVPLTNLTPLLEITADQKANNLAGVPTIGIGTADPEYKAFILSGSTDEERLARALAYNASERPKKVQRAWAALEFGADIKRPTIFLKGLRDRVVYPGLALRYSERIAEAGKSGLLRLYLVRDMTHGGPIDTPAPPQTLFVDAVHKLDAWVQNGDEPGPLNASLLNSDAPDPVESCTIRGFGTDPLGCFCDEMEDVDFNGDPIPECD
jgi:pimeloyl-ACP methyl ester carboxylesterase